MGTSLAEAVRILARQSVLEGGMPFIIHMPSPSSHQRIGVAKGKLTVPDDIDQYNNEIDGLFQ